MLSPSSVITEEEIERYLDVVILLNKVPGVRARRTQFGELSVIIRGMTSVVRPTVPLLLIDDMTMPMIEMLDMIDVFNIAQIDVLKGGEAARFGMRGFGGAISVTTKSRTGTFISELPKFHIRAYTPLGYQHPVEFYAPQYDTPEKRDAQPSDLRTTIHWQPVVQTDDKGSASFEFYTADEQTSYTVIIEGLSDDGRIMRQEEKIWIKE